MHSCIIHTYVTYAMIHTYIARAVLHIAAPYTIYCVLHIAAAYTITAHIPRTRFGWASIPLSCSLSYPYHAPSHAPLMPLLCPSHNPLGWPNSHEQHLRPPAHRWQPSAHEAVCCPPGSSHAIPSHAAAPSCLLQESRLGPVDTRFPLLELPRAVALEVPPALPSFPPSAPPSVL